MLRPLVLLLLSLTMTGCASLNLQEFAHTQPKFDLPVFFAGDTWAYGIFQARGGAVKRQFKVHLIGKQEGDTFVLTEHFTYSDGEKGQRVWRITSDGPDRYLGRADDIVGVAHGHEVGQALNWHYTVKLPYNGSTVEVRFDDWMFRLSDKTMMNRAYVSKFGVRVGEVTIFFSKSDPDR